MFWHLLLILTSPISALVTNLLRDDRGRQVVVLRQQVLILQRQLGKRAHLTRAEKLTLLLVSVKMRRQQLLNSLIIVQPATLLGWHRQIVRHHWTFRPKRRPGRPRTDPQAKQLVLRLARENIEWGCGKIAREMRKLGFADSGRSTVQRILKRHGLWPRPGQAGPSWHDFLSHYGRFIWACDFFTVTTATLRTYYVLFFCEIETRRIVFWNVSDAPDGIWTAQRFRNLSPYPQCAARGQILVLRLLSPVHPRCPSSPLHSCHGRLCVRPNASPQERIATRAQETKAMSAYLNRRSVLGPHE
jgi:hypothetical protein